MKRRVVMFVILVVVMTVDCTLVANFNLLDWRPSLSLAVILSFAASYGALSGSLCGLCVGVMMDLLFAPVRGFYALIFMLSGYAGGVVFEHGISETPLMFGTLTCVVYIVRELVTMLLTALLGVRIGSFFTLLLRYVLPSAILTGLCAIPIYIVLRAVCEAGFMRIRRRVGLD